MPVHFPPPHHIMDDMMGGNKTDMNKSSSLFLQRKPIPYVPVFFFFCLAVFSLASCHDMIENSN